MPAQHIVCYTVGTLGDNVVMLPALAALRHAYPRSSLTVMSFAYGDGTRFAGELFSACPWINRFIPLVDDPVKRVGWKLHFTQKSRASVPCDLFVNLSLFCNTGWLGAVLRELIFAKFLGAKRVIGFRLHSYNRRGKALDKVKHHFLQNEPRRSEIVLRELRLSPEGDSLLVTSDDARQAVARLLAPFAGKQVFVLNPGAKLPVNRWPASRFGELAAELVRRYGVSIAVAGIPSEKRLGDEVIARIPGHGINLSGQTSVPELIELLRRSAACVTNDTGTMHLAAALGLPTVALFTTRISPKHWFPVGPNVIAVFSFSEDSYSYRDEGDSPSKCLLNIEVADVMEALDELLAPGVPHNQDRWGT
jgi:ADP-heptose:LPS heptosyltransferase